MIFHRKKSKPKKFFESQLQFDSSYWIDAAPLVSKYKSGILNKFLWDAVAAFSKRLLLLWARNVLMCISHSIASFCSCYASQNAITITVQNMHHKVSHGVANNGGWTNNLIEITLNTAVNRQFIADFCSILNIYATILFHKYTIWFWWSHC